MAWSPISLIVPQYTINGASASGYVLKAYASGTSTNIPFATNSSGSTQVTSIALNADGFPEVSGNTVIPHIDQTFKLALYPTQAAADANSGAKWTIDGLQPVENISFGNSVNSQTANYTLLTSDKGKLIYYSGAGGVTVNAMTAATAGDGFAFLIENDTTGNVTFDPNGAEQVNGATTFVVSQGTAAIVICNGTSWRAIEWVSEAGTQTITGVKTHTAALIMSGAALNFAAEVSVASAATTDIGAATSNNVLVTGTTNITSLGTANAGIRRWVRFQSAGLVLTHNATSLILPGSLNRTVAANDTAHFLSLGSGNWVCLVYKPADATLRASVHKNGTDQSVASGVISAVSFSTEDYDVGSKFDTGTSQWTPGRVGYALICASVSWDSSAMAGAGFVVTTHIYKNGASYKRKIVAPTDTPLMQGAYISLVVPVTATTDYFSIFASQNTGSAKFIGGETDVTWATFEMLPD